MAIEIERKFLIASDGWRDAVSRSVDMCQGYLVGEGGLASVRVRLHGDTAQLNIKAAVIGAARAEYEYGIPVADAREMLRLCVGRLEKTRHYVEYGGLIWEIDEFHSDNAPLVIAEVELDREDQIFERPTWAGKEVTGERRYYNHHLALHPYRHWPDAS
ncbi:MAG: CYTH domain-containing protein [Stenotrophobium sp.]